jgi:hypothetical protein
MNNAQPPKAKKQVKFTGRNTLHLVEPLEYGLFYQRKLSTEYDEDDDLPKREDIWTDRYLLRVQMLKYANSNTTRPDKDKAAFFAWQRGLQNERKVFGDIDTTMSDYDRRIFKEALQNSLNVSTSPMRWRFTECEQVLPDPDKLDAAKTKRYIEQIGAGALALNIDKAKKLAEYYARRKIACQTAIDNNRALHERIRRQEELMRQERELAWLKQQSQMMQRAQRERTLFRGAKGPQAVCSRIVSAGAPRPRPSLRVQQVPMGRQASRWLHFSLPGKNAAEEQKPADCQKQEESTAPTNESFRVHEGSILVDMLVIPVSLGDLVVARFDKMIDKQTAQYPDWNGRGMESKSFLEWLNSPLEELVNFLTDGLDVEVKLPTILKLLLKAHSITYHQDTDTVDALFGARRDAARSNL